jgi:digeranylgeranylglycerophospholipid reductase
MRDRVAVVGAGTAGLIAAKNLAASGIDTSVYERKRRLGYPPRASGIVSIEGLRGLGIGYRGAVTNTLYGANIHAGNEVLRVLSKRPVAHVLDRERLNGLCCDESMKAGARVYAGRSVDAKMLDDLHRNSIIVGADGAISEVARHFTMGPLGDHVLTYKAEFDSRPRDRRVVDMFFDNDISPGFFGWICPKNKGTLEVGIGISPGHGDSRSAFDRLLKMKEVSEAVGKGRMLNSYASIIPLRARERIVDEKEEILLVGDAAGQVKPTTGGGIVFGGNGAILAARSISDHLNRGEDLAEYGRAFESRFGRDLTMHRILNRVYSGIGAGNLALIMRAAKVLGAEGFLSRHGDMDRPSVMLRRLFLKD